VCKTKRGEKQKCGEIDFKLTRGGKGAAKKVGRNPTQQGKGCAAQTKEKHYRHRGGSTLRVDSCRQKNPRGVWLKKRKFKPRLVGEKGKNVVPHKQSVDQKKTRANKKASTRERKNKNWGLGKFTRDHQKKKNTITKKRGPVITAKLRKNV